MFARLEEFHKQSGIRTPSTAAGEEVFIRRRSQQGNDRKEGPIVGMGGIRLCSLDL